MSVASHRKSQSVSSIGFLKVSLGIPPYAEFFLFAKGGGVLDHFTVSLIPSWSECTREELVYMRPVSRDQDNRARSISEELPKGLVWVGSETICVYKKLCKIHRG